MTIRSPRLHAPIGQLTVLFICSSSIDVSGLVHRYGSACHRRSAGSQHCCDNGLCRLLGASHKANAESKLKLDQTNLCKTLQVWVLGTSNAACISFVSTYLDNIFKAILANPVRNCCVLCNMQPMYFRLSILKLQVRTAQTDIDTRYQTDRVTDGLQQGAS